MTLTETLKKVEKLTIDNSPSLLTAIGVMGTITTAYLAAKASFRAAEMISDDPFLHEQESTMDSDKLLREKVRLVWHVYVPAATAGTTTVFCIIAANRIGNRRAAALAIAYSLSERAFTDYKEKVVETLGRNKEQKIRDEVAQDRVSKNPEGQQVVLLGGDVLCFEAYTGRYFTSNMESLKKAQNDVNYIIIGNMYASLTEFYNRVGLPATNFSEEVGWNNDMLLELEFSTVLSEDGRPCLSVGFLVAPVRDYWRAHR